MLIHSTTLMTFLREAYKTYLEDLDDDVDETAVTDDEGELLLLDSFLNWADNYLGSVNPPVNITYPAIGLGLRLMQGQTITFVDQAGNSVYMRDEGVHVTRPKTIPGSHGINDTSGIQI